MQVCPEFQVFFLKIANLNNCLPLVRIKRSCGVYYQLTGLLFFFLPRIDFADFAGGPEQQQQQQQPITAESPSPATPGQPDATAPVSAVPYTKWYRVWERTSPGDFIQEAFVLPFLILVIVFHIWGSRKNRRKARSWVQAHLPTLESEFAVVGFGGVPNTSSPSTLSNAKSSDFEVSEDLLREDSVDEYATYATGRQNLAFVDVSIKLLKRNNPPRIVGESLLGLFFESLTIPTERMEATAYAFDGKEKDMLPPTTSGDQEQKSSKGGNSTYDGFVFAVAHKSCMRSLRHERYDVSLTFTKDSPKLPESVTVMSESAEITDTLLTSELTQAVEQAGDLFEYLIITDQPMEKPSRYGFASNSPHGTPTCSYYADVS